MSSHTTTIDAGRRACQKTEARASSSCAKPRRSSRAAVRRLALYAGIGVSAMGLAVLVGESLPPPRMGDVAAAASSSAEESVFRVEVEPAEVDFGEVQKATRATTTVTIHNRGTHPVRIADIATTCGCTVAQEPEESIGPGESAEVEVRMSVGTRIGKRTTKTLTFRFEGTNESIKLPVSSTPVMLVASTPATVEMHDSDTCLPLTIRAEDGRSFRVLSASPSVLTGIDGESSLVHELSIDAGKWAEAGLPRSIVITLDHPDVPRLEVPVRRGKAGGSRDDPSVNFSASSSIVESAGEPLLRTDARQWRLGDLAEDDIVHRTLRLVEACPFADSPIKVIAAPVGLDVVVRDRRVVEDRLEIDLELRCACPVVGDFDEPLTLGIGDRRAEVTVRWSVRRESAEQ